MYGVLDNTEYGFWIDLLKSDYPSLKKISELDSEGKTDFAGSIVVMIKRDMETLKEGFAGPTQAMTKKQRDDIYMIVENAPSAKVLHEGLVNIALFARNAGAKDAADILDCCT